MPSQVRLVLEDDTIFEGVGFGGDSAVAGEVVFNTGMVGYPESLTDPSYRGQILIFTYPLIGNYGVPSMEMDEFQLPRGFESDRIHVAGLVVSECSMNYSHHTASRSLHEWLSQENVPGIYGVDTRAITKRLRERGTLLGRIETAGSSLGFSDPNATDLVSTVTAKEERSYRSQDQGRSRPLRVVLMDCGCKANIIRSLLVRGMEVTRVPYDHYFLNMNYDGLVISNGPGDPKMCRNTILNVERALAFGKPILGICLGHQILALAAGADTYKLKFGHRSQNQPCVEQPGLTPRSKMLPGRCYITSQNHGYAVQEESLPEGWRVWFTNANDGTVEGIRHVSKPFYSVQFHPEAVPGPMDTAWIFDDFVREVGRRA